LELFFYQNIAVDTVLDWIPPNIKDMEEIWKLLEQMLLEAFFEHVHYTLGSLSQVIWEGFLQEDFMDAIHWICPQLTALSIVIFELIKGMKDHPDLDFAQR